MLAVKINSVKKYSLSEDGTTVSLDVDAHHVGDLSLLISVDRFEDILRSLKQAQTSMRSQSAMNLNGHAANQVMVSVPRNCTVTADVQGNKGVILVFNRDTDQQAGYALDPNSAKQVAIGLNKSADAVLQRLAHKNQQ